MVRTTSSRPTSLVISVALLVLAAVLLGACGGGLERSALIGRWEGTVPLPATRQNVPITYIFDEPALTVAAGLGPQAIVLEFDSWEIERVVDGQVLIHITAPDGRMFATWMRFLGDEEVMIWDRDTEENTAARVRRVGPPGDAPEATVETPSHDDGTGAVAPPPPPPT